MRDLGAMKLVGVILVRLMGLQYWWECRSFAYLREGSDDPPPPVPPKVVGAGALDTLGSLVAVSAVAKVPARKLQDRMIASRGMTVAAGLVNAFRCRRILSIIPFPKNRGRGSDTPSPINDHSPKTTLVSRSLCYHAII